MAQPQPRTHVARRTAVFSESVIREMTRLAMVHDAINLAQGYPDFPAPDFIKKAAIDAINADINQYAITWGAPRLRNAIAAKTKRFYGLDLEPDREITVTCGATEAMMATMLAVVEEGDEVIVFEPFYENYVPDAAMSGAKLVFVTLHGADFVINPDELRAAFTPRTRAIIVNTPNNPERQGVQPRRTAADRRALPGVRRALHHRRDLRAHPLRRQRAHPNGHAPGHVRPHHHHQRPVEDLQRHRLAARLHPRPAPS